MQLGRCQPAKTTGPGCNANKIAFRQHTYIITMILVHLLRNSTVHFACLGASFAFHQTCNEVAWRDVEGKSIQDAIHWCVHHRCSKSFQRSSSYWISCDQEIAVLQQPLSNDQECLEAKKVWWAVKGPSKRWLWMMSPNYSHFLRVEDIPCKINKEDISSRTINLQ